MKKEIIKHAVRSTPKEGDVGGDVEVDLAAPKERRSWFGRKKEPLLKAPEPPEEINEVNLDEQEDEEDNQEKIKNILDETGPAKKIEQRPQPQQQQQAQQQMKEITITDVKNELKLIASTLSQIADLFVEEPETEEERKEREQYEKLKAKFG